MNVLVTGASGQLASEIKALNSETSHTLFFENHNELDITNKRQVKTYIQKNNIDFVINCAAYTNVDQAENNKIKADQVNGEGVKNLVTALGEKGLMIHVSTDYVFDGDNPIPKKETDKRKPINAYGFSKKAGEDYFLQSKVKGVLLRVSWLYSSFGTNFVKTMLRLGEEKETIRVVNDQIGSPTYAKDLAKLCLFLLDLEYDEKKVYHYSNEGSISWFEFASEIMVMGNRNCKVIPVSSNEFPSIAKRPSFSVLDTTKIKNELNINIPFWKESLQECIKKINT